MQSEPRQGVRPRYRCSSTGSGYSCGAVNSRGPPVGLPPVASAGQWALSEHGAAHAAAGACSRWSFLWGGCLFILLGSCSCCSNGPSWRSCPRGPPAATARFCSSGLCCWPLHCRASCNTLATSCARATAATTTTTTTTCRGASVDLAVLASPWQRCLPDHPVAHAAAGTCGCGSVISGCCVHVIVGCQQW